jgi:hypothetical protein
MFKEVQPQTSIDEKSRLLKALKHEVIELANSADALRALEGHPDNQEVLRYKNLIQESKWIIKKTRRRDIKSTKNYYYLSGFKQTVR